MSISVVTQKGVTVVAIATDSQSTLPPWCQVVKALFCCPSGRSVKNGMRSSSVAVALGTVQVMVGLFNIGLGPERVEAYPYWLGVFFTAAGAASIFADMFPSPHLVGFSVFVSITGSILSIAAVVLYALHLANFTVINMCGVKGDRNPENCVLLAGLAQRLLTGVDVTMIIMSVLQLCVCISLAVLGIKALCYPGKDEDVTDGEIQQPLVEEDHSTSPGA